MKKTRRPKADDLSHISEPLRKLSVPIGTLRPDPRNARQADRNGGTQPAPGRQAVPAVRDDRKRGRCTTWTAGPAGRGTSSASPATPATRSP